MRRSASLVFIVLLLATAAAGADTGGCTVSKGLYEDWLALAKRGSARTTSAKDALLPGATATGRDRQRSNEIGREYQDFFQCLSDAAEQKDEHAVESCCKTAEGDRLATLVCQTLFYLKNGRSGSKEFLDALPTGRKGAEMIWDLEAIAGIGPEKPRAAAIFLPKGPAYQVIDELFLLVLDDKETAAARYFNVSAYASGEGARHLDEQIRILLRESPSVVVKRWVILRQYQPKLKRLLSEMAATMPGTELQKMRRGLAGFCAKDNPDCPEILKLFGRPD